MKVRMENWIRAQKGNLQTHDTTELIPVQFFKFHHLLATLLKTATFGTMNIRVRPALEVDIPAILDITNHEILHSNVLYEYEPRSLDTQLQWFHDKQKQGWPVLVAELDGAVVGFGTYGKFRERVAYRFSVEHSVYVHKDHRGRAIGNALMVELIDRAKAGGFHTMIGVVDSSNKGSVEFHRKFGFEAVGTFKEVGFKFDRWLDAVFMQLIL